MFYVKNIVNIYTAFNIVKLTKNVPKVLNCKTNHNFVLTNMGLPNWGDGGPQHGKSSYIFPFLLWQTSLIILNIIFSVEQHFHVQRLCST